MILSGKALLSGVIGWPIAHSRSPRLHGYWLKKYDIDGAYIPMRVNPDHLSQAITGLIALGFQGANITLPHKEKMLDLVDIIDDRARRIGAVNTLVIHKDGKTEGRNTDAYGYMANLYQQYPAWGDKKLGKNRNIALLGAGGAARAVLDGLLADGAVSVVMTNRNLARAENLANHFQQFYPQVVFKLTTWDQAPNAMADCDLLVNTTNLGMAGQDPLDFPLDGFSPDLVVSDIVYNPLMTPLLVRANQLGMRVVEGLGMLLHQAAPGFATWFGYEPVVDDELRAMMIAAS
jgi:shikimate dehydrogenase